MKNSKVINYYNDKGIILKNKDFKKSKEYPQFNLLFKDFKIYSVYCKTSGETLRVGDNSNYGKILGFEYLNNSPTTREIIVVYQCRGSWKWLRDVIKVSLPANFKNKTVVVSGVKNKFISEGHYFKYITDIKPIRELTLSEVADYLTTPLFTK